MSSKSRDHVHGYAGRLWGRSWLPAWEPMPDLSLRALVQYLLHMSAEAFVRQYDERRFFLWSPIAAACGVIFYMSAEREPPLWMISALFLIAAICTYVVRHHHRAFVFALSLCALTGGACSIAWRSARVAAPVLTHTYIGETQGFVEEVDMRAHGARLLIRPSYVQGLEQDHTPYRIRVTTTYDVSIKAGDYVSFKARLMPPSHASIPYGYDFAREAWFARLGAVGTILGHSLVLASAPSQADLSLRFFAALDQARNHLAWRVDHVIGGPAGAIGAAMVTGKRDFLDDPTRDIIREAGIFHIITIAGVQMTLVAGIFFFGLRRILALSRTLALHYPIKKWAAVLAIIGAVIYDIATGSRIGTERALIMTLIMLGAIVCDRKVMSMRNLALAMWVIILCEPEAILGVSFQLSFAAVAGLIAVYEIKYASRQPDLADKEEAGTQIAAGLNWYGALIDFIARGPLLVLLSTLCASLATLSFMSYHFHEISPYVLIGNPLTLTMIEFFAVPGALLGTFLYPFGLDAFVWHYLGFGIKLVVWMATAIASWPHATFYVPAFVPWSLLLLSCAVLNFVLWRGWLRLMGLPFLCLGIYGAFAVGAPFDLVVPPQVEAIGLRAQDGKLIVVGKSPNRFAVEQWLRADGDDRPERAAVALSQRALERRAARGEVEQPERDEQARVRAHDSEVQCDKIMCRATFVDGRAIYLVYEVEGFSKYCAEADILITPLFAPHDCAPPVLIDRRVLRDRGAVMMHAKADEDVLIGDRNPDDDRPWWPLPQRDWRDQRSISSPSEQDDVFEGDGDDGRLN